MTLAPAPDLPTTAPAPSTRRGGVVARLIRRPLALFGLLVIVIIVAAAIAAPLIAPFAPDDQFFDGLTLEGAPLPPGGDFLLGTDLLGRDLLSRLLYGARTSLVIGVVANGIAVAIGALVGITAGFFGGLDRRGADALHRPDDGLPGAASRDRAGGDLPPEPVDRRAGHRDGELGAARARRLHRDALARASASSSRRNARSAPGGARILFRHILPHLVPTILVWGTLGIATTVLLEATLSFLGVGVQPPTPSWGNIIYENQTYFTDRALAGLHPGRRHHPARARLQSRRRRAPRHPRPDPEGALLMAPTSPAG